MNDRPVLVIDLEATCSDDGSISPQEMEIIELGAVWVTPAGKVLDTLQRFVKPKLRPALTRFCTELTHISQSDVESAPSWPTVASELQAFAQLHTNGQCWGSWGAYDRRQIERECVRHTLAYPLPDLRHENLKALFAKDREMKQVGMHMALKLANLEPLGEHHRALSDAINISRLLPFIANFNGGEVARPSDVTPAFDF
jgi:inhibitor of KinA sporulation pathway (predicted exonuclease)